MFATSNTNQEDNDLKKQYNQLFDKAIQLLSEPTPTEDKEVSVNRFDSIVDALKELKNLIEQGSGCPEQTVDYIAFRAHELVRHLSNKDEPWVNTITQIRVLSTYNKLESEAIKKCLAKIAKLATDVLPFLKKPSDPTQSFHLAEVALEAHRNKISEKIIDAKNQGQQPLLPEGLTHNLDSMLDALKRYKQQLAMAVYSQQISHAEARNISEQAFRLVKSLCCEAPKQEEIVAAISGFQRAASRINTKRVALSALLGAVIGAAIGVLLIFCPPLAILTFMAGMPLVATTGALACATFGAVLGSGSALVADKFCGVTLFRNPLLKKRTAQVASIAMEFNSVITPSLK